MTDIDISPYLHAMVEHEASDLFFSVGAPANIKISGQTRRLGKKALTEEDLHSLAFGVMNGEQQSRFERELEMNLGLSVDNLGRFRINIYRQRGSIAMVIRYISNHIPSLEELNLPAALSDLVMSPRGLVLIVGSTGSGKSTTLASMIDFRNDKTTGHMLTIEDPIEFVHHHKRSIVDQREVGFDTLSFQSALRNAMREAPDVILIGEIRDRETMQQAIAYAETGHLCLSTLHANNAHQAIDRIINFFPETWHRQVYMDLSLNLRAIVAQRLLRNAEGKRVPAVEVLINTPYIADLIRGGDVDQVKDAMTRSKESGMQTFDQSLFELYRNGLITEEQAITFADSRADISVRIRLAKAAPAAGDQGSGLSMMDGDDE